MIRKENKRFWIRSRSKNYNKLNNKSRCTLSLKRHNCVKVDILALGVGFNELNAGAPGMNEDMSPAAGSSPCTVSCTQTLDNNPCCSLHRPLNNTSSPLTRLRCPDVLRHLRRRWFQAGLRTGSLVPLVPLVRTGDDEEERSCAEQEQEQESEEELQVQM